MGIVVSKYAFPKWLPKYNYTQLIGDSLYKIQVENKSKSYHIYAGVYRPPTKTDLTIIYSHGNGYSIDAIHYWSEECSIKYNANFVVYDWRGYGLSEGKASEIALKEDAERVFYFTKQLFPNSRIVAWGFSIGTVATSHIGEMFPQSISAVILQSPMSSAFNVVFKHPCCFCMDQLKNVTSVKNIRCPIYVIHGNMDAIVPFRNSVSIVAEYKKHIKQNIKVNKIVCSRLSYVEEEPIVNSEIIEEYNNEYMQRVTMYRYHDLRFFIIDKGSHNNLDSEFRREIAQIIHHVLTDLHHAHKYEIDVNDDINNDSMIFANAKADVLQ